MSVESRTRPPHGPTTCYQQRRARSWQEPDPRRESAPRQRSRPSSRAPWCLETSKNGTCPQLSHAPSPSTSVKLRYTASPLEAASRHLACWHVPRGGNDRRRRAPERERARHGNARKTSADPLKHRCHSPFIVGGALLAPQNRHEPGAPILAENLRSAD